MATATTDTTASEAATDAKVAALVTAATAAGTALTTANTVLATAQTTLADAVAALGTPATPAQLAAVETAQAAVTSAAGAVTTAATAATAAVTAANAAATAANETAPALGAVTAAVTAGTAAVATATTDTTASEAATDAKVAALVTAATAAGTALGSAAVALTTADTALAEAVAAVASPATPAQLADVQAAQAVVTSAVAALANAITAATTAVTVANTAATSANETADLSTVTAAITAAITVRTVGFSADLGASATDFITTTAEQTISGTLSANLVAGQVVKVSLDNGSTWQTAAAAVGTNTFSLSGVTLLASNTLKLQVEDAAGNTSAARSQAYVYDTAWSVITTDDVAENAGTINYTVSRTGASGAATIQFTTAGGTASADTDYTAANQTLSFADGEMSKTVTVALLNDTVAETNETVIAVISGASHGSVATATATATATILDNDQSVWTVTAGTDLSSTASAYTVSEDGASIVYTVSRTGATSAATIQFTTAGGTASVGTDYTAANQTLNFADGEMSKTVTVALTDDMLNEINETVTAVISSASNGTISTGSATATILDNDQSVWTLTAGTDLSSTALPYTVDEGGGTMVYTVSRTGASDAATIQFATTGGSASTGADYTAASQTLSFAAGEMSKTVTVAIADDALNEINETVSSTISRASRGVITTATATATILDNDQSVWTVESGDSVSEEAGFITFIVSRTGLSNAATVSVATAGGTATAGLDYTAFNTVLSFAAGETSKVISVALLSDSIAEINETVSLVIGSPSTGVIGTAIATATILDNDSTTWTVQANTSGALEGAGAQLFTVSRSGQYDATQTIVVNTAGGTATPGTDYDALLQTLTFAPGETSKTVSVNILNDSLPESGESIGLTLGNQSSGTIATAVATATITDDDLSVWAVSANAVDAYEAEGALQFTVTRSGQSATTATIVVNTLGGSATAGEDYTALLQTLTFGAGETSKAVSVSILDDSVAESSETIALVLSAQSSGTIGTARATSTITDDDLSIWSVVANTSGAYEASGPQLFTVSRANQSSTTETIVISSTGGTASAGSDFTAVNQTLTFGAGETSKVVSVSVTDDSVGESSETVGLTLSGQSRGNIGTALALATVVDDDISAWSVVANTASGAESSGALRFTVSRTGQIDSTETIVLTTGGGSASAGSDFTALNQTLTFEAGQASQVVTVDITNDGLAESAETVGVSLGGQSRGTITTARASATITDDDLAIWSIAANTSGAFESSGTQVFTVSRANQYDTTETIVVNTSGGSATPGTDYSALLQTLTFAAGQTSQTVAVTVINDGTPESAETMAVAISGQSRGTIGTPVVSAVITDDDLSIWSVAAGASSSESTGTQLFTVSRANQSATTETIVVSTGPGTGTPGTDFTALNETLTFGAGETSKSVFVNILNDSIGEPSETVSLVISGQSSGNLGSALATATITDDDLAIWSVAANTGSVNESGGAQLFTVSRANQSATTETIVVSTGGGTASAGSDYTAVNQTLTFGAGQTSQTVSVNVINDTLGEDNEFFTLNLGGQSSGTLGAATAYSTITDNDQSVWTVAANTSGAFEAAGAQLFTVSRANQSDTTETIVVNTTGGSATAGVDYTALLQTLTFGAGQTSQTVSVGILNDSVPEASETVGLALGQPSTGTIGTALAVTGITDDDLSIWSIAANTSGAFEASGQQLFTVSRANQYDTTETIVVNTTGGNATQGSDYSAFVQTLTFAAGQTSQTVSVTVINDSTPEASETLAMAISGHSRGTIGTSFASATIADDDLSVWSVASLGGSTEGSGQSLFSVSRSNQSATTETIVVTSSGGSASAGSDFTAVNQTLTFGPGESVKTVTVNIVNDSIGEPSEIVSLAIGSPSAGTIGTYFANATLTDDDLSAWSVNATGGSIGESAGAQLFTVSRSNQSATTETIVVSTGGGTASAGSDYTAVNQTLTFGAGQTSQTVSVNLVNDSVAETSETLTLTLGGQSAGTLANGSASTTLIDDDQSVWSVSASTNPAFEGSGALLFTVSRANQSSATQTIVVNTTGGSATAGVDYTALLQTLTFGAGQTSQTVSVALLNDAVPEAEETVALAIGQQSGGTIDSAFDTASVTDDDLSIWSIEANTSGAYEGSKEQLFTVSRENYYDGTETIVVNTVGGTATQGVDYTALTQTLTFGLGETSKTVAVAMLDDALAEQGETVVLALSRPSSGNVSATSSASAAITDDDVMMWSVASSLSPSEGSGSMPFTVKRTGQFDTTETIVFETAGYTATSGQDFVPVYKTLTFGAGVSSQSVSVDMLDDNVAETSEYLQGVISQPSKGLLFSSSTNPIVIDDDLSNWLVTATTASAAEGAGVQLFTVSRSNQSANVETIVVQTAGGTATAGVDYTALLQTLTFGVGETSRTVAVALLNDSVGEGSETVTVTLTGQSGGTIASLGSSPRNASASATITDEDQSVWGIEASTPEAYEGSGQQLFTVTRATPSANAETVVVSTAGGSATAGVDYTALLQTLTFAPGQTSQTVAVTVLNDSLAESAETVVMALSNQSGGALGTASATASITDDDISTWSVEANNSGAFEGAGAQLFTVSRAGQWGTTETIVVKTGGGSATEGLDYTALLQTLTFGMGQTSQTVAVNVLNDSLGEVAETVVLSLVSQSSGNIANATASATLRDDDLSVWTVVQNTANASEGVGKGTFFVSRSAPFDTTETIVVNTLATRSVANVDYAPLLQTLTFTPGQSTQSVSTDIFDNSVPEPAKGLGLSISNPSAGTVGSNGWALGNMPDDDGMPAFAVSAINASASEGAGALSFFVTVGNGFSRALLDTATVVVRTVAGTAIEGVDYTAVYQTLTFGPGQYGQVVNVNLLNDSVGEGAKTLSLALSDNTAGTLSNTLSASATITDDDVMAWSVAATPDTLEDAGHQLFTVSRTNPSSVTETIVVSTVGGTATAGVDYTALLQTLTFKPGETIKTVSVALGNDSVGEESETVIVALSDASHGSLAAGTATANLTDDDISVWSVEANTTGASEGAGLQLFTVSRANQSANVETIVFSTTGGTATAGSDYTGTLQTLTFAAGQTNQTVSVAVIDDTAGEAAETMTVALSNQSGGTLDVATASASIADNDLTTWAVASAFSGNEGAVYVYTVTRAGNKDNAATIEYATSGGTALAGVDYTPAFGTLSFAAGETVKTVTVMVTVDNLAEGLFSEQLPLVIFNASSGSLPGTVGNASSSGMSDPVTSSYAVTAVNSGALEAAGTAVFRVARTNSLSDTQTVVYSTVAGTATAADFTAISGTLTFTPGEQFKAVTVNVLGDGVADGSKAFSLQITPTLGDIGATSAAFTIADSDAAAAVPTFTLVAVNDGTAEAAGKAVFSVTRAANLLATATVEFLTSGGGTGTAADYTAVAARTLTFAPGETVQQVTVDLLADGVADGVKTFDAALQNASGGGTVNGVQAFSIADSEFSDVPNFTLATVNSGAVEAVGRAVFVVTRDTNLLGTDTVEFLTDGSGTGTAGSDYTAVAARTLTFAPGETVKQVTVDLLADGLVDGTKTFGAMLQNASGSGTVDGVQTFSIADSQAVAAAPAFAVAVTSNNVVEAAGYIAYNVTRTLNLLGTDTIEYKTNTLGTATTGVDFTTLAVQTLTFAPGESIKTVAVQVINDTAVEIVETVGLTLQNASAGTIGTASVLANLVSDDMLTTGVGNDTVTMNSATGFGGAPVGYLLDTGDGNDTITMPAAGVFWGQVLAGAGDDTVKLAASTGTAMFLSGVSIMGGSGLDTLMFSGASTSLNLRGQSTGGIVQGFETVNLTGTGNNTLSVGLNDLLDMTTGNAVARTLKVDGNLNDVINLGGLGITGQTGALAPRFTTPAAGATVTNVDGTGYTVAASAAGDASANDVTFGGHTYDVYQFSSSAGMFTLLADTTITRTFLA